MTFLNAYDELAARGFIHQETSATLKERLQSGIPLTAYIGFDPTAISLHVGSLMPIFALRILQRHGHQVIALMGGGTGMIGDPSGKSAERNLLDEAILAKNRAGIEAQIARLLGDAGKRPKFIDNFYWLGKLGLIEFLRDTGKHFSVNAMLHKDSVRLRLEREGEGISFTEFSYSLLQARDFLELYQRETCVLQLGGSDQWGNIVAGVDLVRRVTGAEVYGLTLPLLTKADGTKFGKTEDGTVYFDPALTSPYHFYQFWINQSDKDVIRLLHLFSDLSASEIKDLEASLGSGERLAQKKLATTITSLVYHPVIAEQAQQTSELLFSNQLRALSQEQLDHAFSNAPTSRVSAEQVTAGMRMIDFLVTVGIVASKGEAKRLIEQNGLQINGETVRGLDEIFDGSRLMHNKIAVIRRGKKDYHLVHVGTR